MSQHLSVNITNSSSKTRIGSERLEAYNRAFALRCEGLGPRRISKLINVSMHTIGTWFYQDSHPLGGTHRFETKPSSELSYVIGVYLGDGYAYYNKTSQCYRICLKVKDKNFAGFFSEAISKVVGRSKPYKVMSLKKGLYNVECGSYLLFSLLKQSLDKLKSYITLFPIEFLRGFYESEGNLSIRRFYWDTQKKKHPSKTFQLRLSMSNLNRQLLLIVKEVLENLGFHPTLCGPYKHYSGPLISRLAYCEEYNVRLSRNNEVRRFIDLVMPCIKRGGI
jgi:DNA endonuclease